jgi:glycosyltransferase involved in cell wall biosynthesis
MNTEKTNMRSINTILFIIESLGPGGAERQLVGLAAMLKGLGYEIVVFTYTKNEFYLPFLIESDVKYNRFDKASSRSKRLFILSNAVNKLAPDVVISFNDGPNLLSCLLRVFGHKFKLIVSERNTNQNLKLTFKDIVKFNFYRKADYIVANSFTQKEFIKNKFTTLTNKLFTITNFTDINIFSPISSQTIKNTTLCICVGRLVPQKNVHLFIKAIAKLKDKGYMLKVKWYGYVQDEDEYSSKCLSLIKYYNLQKIFTFEEPTKLIHDEYQKANLFCLPSLHEGYPNALCEAMSSGLPVLCSNVSDNPILVVNNVNGFVFDPNDINKIVNSFINFFSLSKLEKKKMGELNRSKAKSIFSKEVFLKKYLQLIDPKNNDLNIRSI